MLESAPLYTKEREKSDMADLEVLGSLSFDLSINKDEKIKEAFVSLVSKLGTKEFMLEYSALYSKILAIHERRRNCMCSEPVESLFSLEIEEPEHSTNPLETCILNEISISTDYVNKPAL
ncbi:uncharacterized protein NEMAJ01_1919 [Nematocida major]|uniref:uncharacterized protein n=1 Tax=Nematocida major TaxID=1912982 RepID=UPI002008E277|nr:uncharacterized protein NEMAJ01_1919 [Nematocida major]KAH9387023.1 hypothetical protein NEMAJ01_1919 [Nematocida major]